MRASSGEKIATFSSRGKTGAETIAASFATVRVRSPAFPRAPAAFPNESGGEIATHSPLLLQECRISVAAEIGVVVMSQLLA
jgi:hypothetical protein